MVPYDGPVKANAGEIDEIRWLTPVDLREWFEKDASRFTYWFAEAFCRMIRLI
jgi:isopentenyldiphosphate isomerase